jgi:hypothetical protein
VRRAEPMSWLVYADRWRTRSGRRSSKREPRERRFSCHQAAGAGVEAVGASRAMQRRWQTLVQIALSELTPHPDPRRT